MMPYEPTAGQGGGGGGGGHGDWSPTYGGQGGAGGGGVGEPTAGANGAAGTNGNANYEIYPTGGDGGSPGTLGGGLVADGYSPSYNGVGGQGGAYGGGAGGGYNNMESELPGPSFLRIMWGPGRAYPSTNTADV